MRYALWSFVCFLGTGIVIGTVALAEHPHGYECCAPPPPPIGDVLGVLVILSSLWVGGAGLGLRGVLAGSRQAWAPLMLNLIPITFAAATVLRASLS